MAKKGKGKPAQADEPQDTSTEPKVPVAELFQERKPAKVAKIELVTIALDDIVPNPKNVNVESDATFEGLKAGISEDGFDEPPQVITTWGDRSKPETWVYSRPAGASEKPDFYKLNGGEWRWRALRDLGFTHVDCYVRTDWDNLKQYFKMVRRNLQRGGVDDEKFTTLVNEIMVDYNVELEAISELMGFEAYDDFISHYLKEDDSDNDPESLESKIEDIEKETAHLDNLQLVIRELLKRYGDTLTADFMHFFYLRRWHLMLRLSEDGKKAVDKMIRFVKAERKDEAMFAEKGFPITESTNLNEFLVSAVDAELARRKKAKEATTAPESA